MQKMDVLRDIGLSKSESKIYTTLLRLGEATVADISKSSGMHRTNIYDSLEKLKNKGLVSFLLKERRQFFRAADPENLLAYLREKENTITKYLPELKEIQTKISEEVSVETLKGPQGIKSALKDILRQRTEVVGYSIAGQMRKFLPEFAQYYFGEQTKYKILHRFIYTKGVIKPPSSFYEIRHLPKEYGSTIISICYGDALLYLIWEPEMIAIRIRSKQLASSFRQHFDLLWKIAKSRPR